MNDAACRLYSSSHALHTAKPLLRVNPCGKKPFAFLRLLKQNALMQRRTNFRFLKHQTATMQITAARGV